MNKKHGMHHTQLYREWGYMKNRCYNPNSDSYKYYGARGIIICDEWKDDFMAFYNWAYNNGYVDGLSIERIDVNGNYEPKNCCWIPVNKQARNTRRTYIVEYNGKKMSLAEACELADMNYATVDNRIFNLKWSFEKAINTPIQKYDQITFNGKTQPLKAWARELGINYSVLCNRIKRNGWEIDRAFTQPVRHKKKNGDRCGY